VCLYFYEPISAIPMTRRVVILELELECFGWMKGPIGLGDGTKEVDCESKLLK
jgi:hypothetical protein